MRRPPQLLRCERASYFSTCEFRTYVPPNANSVANGPSKVSAPSLACPQESPRPRAGASCKRRHSYGCHVMRRNLRCWHPWHRIQPHVSTCQRRRKRAGIVVYMKDSSTVSSPGPSDRSAEAPLDSWKEIATHVKRDVSTVQRWEKREGMPVHRHVHDKRGSVYAFSSELDAWLQSRKLRLEEEEEGDKAETPVDAECGHGTKGTPRARLRLVLAGMAVLALLSVTYVLIRSRAGNSRQAKISSLAVLPLKNLSGDSTQEYLADGMTEALIGRLSGIHDLRVISRTSVMRFKDTQLSVPEIARTLRVDAIVEGSVIREGSRIRVHAQLIRGATDEHIWSESYDRELRDVLALQSDVARSIAERTKISLTRQERVDLAPTRAVDPEAHEDYLKGRYYFNQRTADALNKSIAYFQQAISRDPSYALAYSGLADAYALLGFRGRFPSKDALSRAKAAALKAIAADDTLA